jgi:hypothetical protein
MSEHGLTDWATATPAQNEQRQQNHTATKPKCVLEQSALLKASVGNTEVPKWSDGNKEAVESRAIELRHKLTQHLGQRVQHPATSGHVRYETPPSAKDPKAEKLEYPDETLTPEERTSNIREVDVTHFGKKYGEPGVKRPGSRSLCAGLCSPGLYPVFLGNPSGLSRSFSTFRLFGHRTSGLSRYFPGALSHWPCRAY